MTTIDVRVTDEAIDVNAAIAFVGGAASGAIVVFLGTVRDATGGRDVRRLDYEAYGDMAESEMEALARTAIDEHGAQRVAIVHRVGTLEIGDVAVAIAVAGAHRGEAYAASRWLIDTLKQRVPIWKKEWYEDGGTWIAEHP